MNPPVLYVGLVISSDLDRLSELFILQLGEHLFEIILEFCGLSLGSVWAY
jgi:hypothetical protein